MKKRVHFHQLRVGMYVEEIEGEGPRREKPRHQFLIATADDLRQVLGYRAMSAIIDTVKGDDVEAGAAVFSPADRARFEEGLAQTYSAGEIRRAKAAIARTAPQVKHLLKTAHAQNTVDMDCASAAVGEIMTSAASNPGALIGLSRLKDRDEATFLHSLSVSALMVTFGRALGLGESEVRILGIGGLVHDLGKMTIPLDVLGKNGQLTDGEFAVMRSHPERGYEMLRKIEGMDPSVLDICRYHHEKYDGGGYPQGLRGEAIPYSARIAAICDVYDALTTVRPYKKAWTQAEAVERMLQARGHFDPALVKAFVSRMIVSGTII